MYSQDQTKLVIVVSIWGSLVQLVSSFGPPQTTSPATTHLFSFSTEKLIPEENPDFDPTRESSSGIPYVDVSEGLNRLYPPEALEERNAASRTDGYWPFIQKGEDPPKQFTYGEFDFFFLAELLDRAVVQEYAKTSWDDKVFCDIGSGTGRLVLGAAALHPGWKLCRGIEILEGISDVAQSKLESCREDVSNIHIDEGEAEELDEWTENENGLLVKAIETKEEQEEGGEAAGQKEADDIIEHGYALPVDDDKRRSLAPVEFVCGSFEDPYLYFGDVDCVFCFSSCMSSSILQSLSQAVGRQCRPGAIVITTDFSLELRGYIPANADDEDLPHGEYQLALLETVDGYCWLTGGQSTAYIHRVEKSLWDGTGPRIKPELPISEKAFRAVMAMEEAKDSSAIRFLSGVRNNMFFAGFPEKWIPDPARYQPSLDADE